MNHNRLPHQRSGRLPKPRSTEEHFLRLFFSLRGLMLIASAGAILGALLMFWAGGIHLYHALETLLGIAVPPQTAAEEAAKTSGDKAQVIVFVLEAVDAFLFALVLMIFSYGIALGFVFHHLQDRYAGYLPAWMLVDGVGQLKRTLAEVVIVVLIIIFARTVIESHGNLSWTMLVLPLSIVALSFAVKLLHGLDKGDMPSPHADKGNGDNQPAPKKAGMQP